MLGLKTKLEDLERDKNPICIGIVGAGETDTGQRGATLIEQIESVPGITTLTVADSSINEAIYAFKKSGIPEREIEIADNLSLAAKAITGGKRVVTQNFDMVPKLASIQALLVATKDPEKSATVAFKSIMEKKHVVMLNALADVTVGSVLKLIADNAGVVYTFSVGDEPGVILELCSFAQILGLKVIAAGKGKNNPLNQSVTPDDLKEASQTSGASPQALASFVDGTKTMLEMTALANATGFIPDKRGMHGPKASVDDLLNIFCLKEEGGILSRIGIVDYAIGNVAPGVFVIVRTEQKSLVDELKYLKMGEGPSYLLYRPYHLGNIEAPLSIAKAIFDGEPSIAPLGAPIAETITVAKRDLRAGEEIDDIGGYTVYGTIERAEIVKTENLLPLGLAKGAKFLSDVEAGHCISYGQVRLDENSLMWVLRRLQDRLCKN
jgi:predicted homoserine dehydrogenase-like protein